MIALVIGASQFPSKTDENKTLFTIELSDGSTVFADEAKQKDFPIGTTVVVTNKKYKSGEVWKTSKTITKVTIG